MISVAPCLFYFYAYNIQNVVGVRIFQNVLPEPMPTKFVEFQPEVLSKTCLLKPDEGPCRGNIDMYYYSPESSNCSTFTWGGCQGNGNRFNSEAECRRKCLSRQGGPKRRPKWCALTFDYGFCFGAVKRYYFDNLWKVCKETVYSGCGGNRNNFYSFDQCESICLYGNGPLTLQDRAVTAPKKVLIINPDAPQVRSVGKQSDTGDGKSGDGSNGNGNGNTGNGNGNTGNGNGNTGNGNGNTDNGNGNTGNGQNSGNGNQGGNQVGNMGIARSGDGNNNKHGKRDRHNKNQRSNDNNAGDDNANVNDNTIS